MTPTATSQPPFITLEGVTKRWSNGATVLDGITFKAERGEFISLIGPSGCGKSTLLRLLAGLSPVSSGSVKLDGMQPESAREIMSFIFQDATMSNSASNWRARPPNHSVERLPPHCCNSLDFPMWQTSIHGS